MTKKTYSKAYLIVVIVMGLLILSTASRPSAISRSVAAVNVVDDEVPAAVMSKNFNCPKGLDKAEKQLMLASPKRKVPIDYGVPPPGHGFGTHHVVPAPPSS